MYPSLASTCYVAKDELELLCLLPKCWEYHVYTIYPARVLFNGKLKLECKMIFLGCVWGGVQAWDFAQSWRQSPTEPHYLPLKVILNAKLCLELCSQVSKPNAYTPTCPEDHAVLVQFVHEPTACTKYLSYFEGTVSSKICNNYL